MITYSIHVTKAAMRDLINASDYIEFNLSNQSAAIALEDEAEASFVSLASNPERFALVDDPFLAMRNIRFVIVKNFLGFYVIDELEQTVHIIRFLYSGQNWIEILSNGFSIE